MRSLSRLSAWIPVLAGLGLLVSASRIGNLALALALLPGVLLLAGGVRSLLSAGDRSSQHVATGAVLGVLLALPLGLAGGAALGWATLAASVASFLATGWLAILLEPPLDEVPAPAPSLGYSARVALDDAMLHMMTLAAPRPTREALGDAVAEAEAAHAVYLQRGWIEDPESFHAVPPEIEKLESSPERVAGLELEHVRFESGFEPDPELPGRERWLGYAENHTAHAWLLRRPGPGPWLVGVHGAGMGDPKQGVQAFHAKKLHRDAGLNVALVALPVHGPRAPSRFSGKEFLGLSPLDFVHAESQAVWDLRRLIAWLRSQQATQVGVYGISLGAYTSAVLAGLEPGLACVIAGVPPADLVHTSERITSALERRYAIAAGLDPERERVLHRVVSPLALAPKLERDRRFIYASSGDRFVPAFQVRALWRHWERPRILWCKGGHVSALMQRDPRTLVDEAVASSFEVAASA